MLGENNSAIRADSKRIRILRTSLIWLTAILLIKVAAGVVFQYGSYFPPDFDEGFLLSRKSYFFGAYGVAFYIHIIVGPVALILGGLLMTRQWKKNWPVGKQLNRWLDKNHRSIGRIQFTIVLIALVPRWVCDGNTGVRWYGRRVGINDAGNCDCHHNRNGSVSRESKTNQTTSDLGNTLFHPAVFTAVTSDGNGID